MTDSTAIAEYLVSIAEVKGCEVAVPVALESDVECMAQLFSAASARRVVICTAPMGCITLVPPLDAKDEDLLSLAAALWFCRQHGVSQSSVAAHFLERLTAGSTTADDGGRTAMAQLHRATCVLRTASFLCAVAEVPAPKRDHNVLCHVRSYASVMNALEEMIALNECCPQALNILRVIAKGAQSAAADDDDNVGDVKHDVGRKLGRGAGSAAGATSTSPDDFTEVVDDSKEREKVFLREEDFSIISNSGIFFDETAKDFTKLAAIYLSNQLPAELCREACRVLQPAASTKNMRGNLSDTIPETGIVGYYDYLTNPTQYKCRETLFTRQNWPAVFDGARPLLRELDRIYQVSAPYHYRLQKNAIPSQFQLFDTVFSTITVNHNLRTAQHTDKGDFKSGLGIVTVIDGDFDGCHLALPKLGKAFRLRVGDVLLFDTSLLHGNTEVKCPDGMWHRTSLVCYYRTGLASPQCRDMRVRDVMRRLPPPSGNVVNLLSDESGGSLTNGLYLPAALPRMLSKAQLNALLFANECMQRNTGCIIAMSMGLGKTLLGLSLCFSFLYAHPLDDILVVTPKTIVPHWLEEASKWQSTAMLTMPSMVSPDLSTTEFDTALLRYNQQCDGLTSAVKRSHVFLLNPEAVASVLRRCPSFDPKLILLDEGHRVSSKDSKLRECLRQLSTQRRIVLSGTPIQNDLDELYRLVIFTNPAVVATHPPESFREMCTVVEEFVAGDNSKLDEARRSLSYILEWQKAFVLRYTDADLPRLDDFLVVCGTSATQAQMTSRFGMENTALSLRACDHRSFHLSAHPLCLIGFFKSLWSKSASEYERVSLSSSASAAAVNGGATGFASTAAMNSVVAAEAAAGATTVMPMSRVEESPSTAQRAPLQQSDGTCSSPEENQYCLEYCLAMQQRMQRNAGNPAAAVEELVSESGKLTVALKIAMHCAAIREKVVIFSQYVAVQDIVERVVKSAGLIVYGMRGKDSLDTRKRTMQRFATDEHCFVLVVSTKVGAFGVDLTAANHVVLFDHWWNPQVEAQAIARCYRRNQNKPVSVYRLTSQGEDGPVIRAQQRKVALFRSVMDGQVTGVTDVMKTALATHAIGALGEADDGGDREDDESGVGGKQSSSPLSRSSLGVKRERDDDSAAAPSRRVPPSAKLLWQSLRRTKLQGGESAVKAVVRYDELIVDYGMLTKS